MSHLFITDPKTGRIRLTGSAKEKYAKEFAQSGYDINRITTSSEFLAAVNANFNREMRNMALTERGKDPLLDEVLQGLPGWD